MGYYTNFEIEIAAGNELTTEIDAAIRKCVFCYKAGETFTAKWYDVDVDMRYISEQFPNVKFRVCGVGEDSGDIWETEFLNGVITRDASAKIVMIEESRMAEFNKLMQTHMFDIKSVD